MPQPPFYTPTFTRALRSYTASGFFAPDLDADDHAFIEGIRERGVIGCGALTDFMGGSTTNDYAEAEQKFWDRRWPTEPDVKLRSPPPKPPRQPKRVTPAAQRMRANRLAVATANAETQREWDEQQQQLTREREWRILKNMLADYEWDKATAQLMLKRATITARYTTHQIIPVKIEAPAKPAPPGPLDDYRLAQKRRAQREAAYYAKLSEEQSNTVHARKRKEEKAEARRQELRRQQRIAQQQAEEQRELEAKRAEELAKAAKAEERANQHKSAERLAFEARVAETARLQHEQAMRQYMETKRQPWMHDLKVKISGVIKGTGTLLWTVEALMDATGCNDPEMIRAAAQSLVNDGYIHERHE